MCESPREWLTISTLLRIEKVEERDVACGVDFHVDCLSQDVSGQVFPLGIYAHASGQGEAEELRKQLQPGEVYGVTDKSVHWEGWRICLYSPELKPYSGDKETFNEKLNRYYLSPGPSNQEDLAILSGQIANLQIQETKRGDLMAIARVKTASGEFDAIIFPEVYARNVELIKVDQWLVFSGALTPARETEGGSVALLSVESICHDVRD